MNRKLVLALTCVMMIGMLSGCGKKKDAANEAASQDPTITVDDAGSSASSSDVEVKASEDESTGLAAPIVKGGVMKDGSEAIDVEFEWNPVDGADGYEVDIQSKAEDDKEYAAYEPGYTELEKDGDYFITKDTKFVASAQDDFDFQIKVRAFKGEGDDKTYSDWSKVAYGQTYDK
ncbi:hypothetical protein D6856_04520 [Butyrivibrio sp. XB500-5]|uniref:hypothetical protein n=1 Tax=Butyrivibrio sp. XB500-5 TaxID=2364880 RepID=UPI000EA90A55|nr:hypothetical protein [Butyrivibrio sp. XB500-5]RKM63393.1 hypothetical protein D6856_04520 [Butyrivibrio sp. XB500-5]